MLALKFLVISIISFAMKMKIVLSCSVVSDSLGPHGL